MTFSSTELISAGDDPTLREGRRGRIVGAIVALGAVLCIQGATRLPCISRDGVFFVQFAEQIRADSIAALSSQTKQPGYSILLLGLHSLIGRFISDRPAISWEVCGQIIAVLGGTEVVWLVYVLTRRLFDATTGLMAACLAAFWPQLVTLSSDVLSDAPHLALYLAGLLLGLRAMGGEKRQNAEPPKRRNGEAESTDSAVGRRWGTLVACGAVCGAAYWLRQEALGAMAAVVLCLLWPAEGTALRRRMARAAAVVVAFVVVAAPYSIAVGKVMPNKSIKDLLFGEEKHQNAETPKRRNEDKKTGDGTDFQETRNWKLETRSRRAGPVMWWDAPVKMLAGWSKSGRYALSTLALVGFFWRRVPRSAPPVKRLVMIAALLQIVAAQARGMQYGVISDRYLLILAGLSIPWSAAGLMAIAGYANDRIRRGRDVLASFGIARRSFTVAALIAIAPMAYYDLRPAPKGAYWQRDAGQWIAEHASAGDVVLAAPQRSPVSFYAGLERRWPVGADMTKSVTRPRAVWVVDDPGMSRATDTEKSLLAICRTNLRANEPSRAWRTEGGEEAKVYRIVSGPTWEDLR